MDGKSYAETSTHASLAYFTVYHWLKGCLLLSNYSSFSYTLFVLLLFVSRGAPFCSLSRFCRSSQNILIKRYQTSLVGSLSIRARKELLEIVQSYANMLRLSLLRVERVVLVLNRNCAYKLWLGLHMFTVVWVLSWRISRSCHRNRARV